MQINFPKNNRPLLYFAFATLMARVASICADVGATGGVGRADHGAGTTGADVGKTVTGDITTGGVGRTGHGKGTTGAGAGTSGHRSDKTGGDVGETGAGDTTTDGVGRTGDGDDTTGAGAGTSYRDDDTNGAGRGAALVAVAMAQPNSDTDGHAAFDTGKAQLEVLAAQAPQQAQSLMCFDVDSRLYYETMCCILCLRGAH